MRRLGVGVAVVLSVAACTPVNEEAGKPWATPSSC